jgi:hypothetical protein
VQHRLSRHVSATLSLRFPIQDGGPRTQHAKVLRDVLPTLVLPVAEVMCEFVRLTGFLVLSFLKICKVMAVLTVLSQ